MNLSFLQVWQRLRFGCPEEECDPWVDGHPEGLAERAQEESLPDKRRKDHARNNHKNDSHTGSNVNNVFFSVFIVQTWSVNEDVIKPYVWFITCNHFHRIENIHNGSNSYKLCGVGTYYFILCQILCHTLSQLKKSYFTFKCENAKAKFLILFHLVQVSTWFANARRRLKKENKMTWEPKNKLDDEDVDVSDDDEKDKDDDRHGKASHQNIIPIIF